jgi:hypothetical protein
MRFLLLLELARPFVFYNLQGILIAEVWRLNFGSPGRVSEMQRREGLSQLIRPNEVA